MTNYVTSRVASEDFFSGFVSATTNNNFEMNPSQLLIKRSRGRPRKESSARIHMEKLHDLSNHKSPQVNSFGEKLKIQSIPYDNLKNNLNEKICVSRSKSNQKKENIFPIIELTEEEPQFNKINMEPKSNQENTTKNNNNYNKVNRGFAVSTSTTTSSNESVSNNIKITDVSEILSPNQKIVFAYFATLNPQNLIKDEKFYAVKNMISMKYSEDRVKNLLCMYLLYSEKELKNNSDNNFDTRSTNNNFNNISFNSFKICHNQISENFPNFNGKKFEKKNLTVTSKVNDFNVLEDAKKCLSHVTETKSNPILTADDKKPNESQTILREKNESTLPLNIFNNFTQNAMKDTQNPYQYPPYNFALPNMPFNPNQTPFFYNPLYYCLPPMIPSTQMLQYNQYHSQLSNGNDTKSAGNTTIIEASIMNEGINEEKKDSTNLLREKGKCLLRKKRQRNGKGGQGVNTSRTGDSTLNNSRDEEISKTMNDFEINIEPMIDVHIPTPCKEIAAITTAPVDIFDKVSNEMENMYKTPSFHANEEAYNFQDNSFSVDNYLDFHNEYPNSPKFRDNFDLSSLSENYLGNGVLNFNSMVDKGFQDKFPSNLDLSVYSPVHGNDQSIERKNSLNSLETQGKPSKSTISTDKSNVTTSTLSQITMNSRPQKTIQSTSNINSLSVSLLPSLIDSKKGETESNRSSVNISEKKNKIIKLLEDISNRRVFDKLRDLIPEQSFKILEDCFFLQSNEIMSKPEVTVCLIANFYLKFVPRSNTYTVFRTGNK